MSASTVFLSYAREDRSKIEQIYEALMAEGFKPWLDSRSITPGVNWSHEIGRAMRAADFVLLFISQQSVSKRGYVQTELKAALSLLDERSSDDVFLIPVRLDESTPPSRLQQLQWVDLFAPDGWQSLLKALRARQDASIQRTVPARDRASSEPLATRRDNETDHRIFVAMPFAVEMEDVYFYGIEKAILANGFRSIRVDQEAFTGDVLAQIRSGIDAAIAMIAEVSSPNPNVHLELGYAWARGIPTLLLLKDGSTLCFDLRGQRFISYQTIKSLEVALTKELERLIANGRIGS